MRPVETASLLAVCGDVQTGSSTVFANGKGVSRVMVDTAVGLIAGPGSRMVIVEGFKTSVVGDIVQTHPPCPLIPIHCASPVNLVGQPSVIIGGERGRFVPLGGFMGPAPEGEWNPDYGEGAPNAPPPDPGGGGSGNWWDDFVDDVIDDLCPDWLCNGWF